MLLLHIMSPEAERIQALHADEPAGLRVAGGKPSPSQADQPKLPVEIHGVRVYVDDTGTWYAASSAAAARLQDVLNGTPGAGGGPLALEMAEVYARAVIRKMGAGRLLFTPDWPVSSYRYPPGATAS